MIFNRFLLAVMPVTGALADLRALGTTSSSCKNGAITLRGRYCTRHCGYEFTSGSYKNDWRSCFDDCAKACAADSCCLDAKWSRTSKKCYYRSDSASYLQKTGRGDTVRCKKPKPVTTTKCTTTTSTTRTTTTTTTSAASGPTCLSLNYIPPFIDANTYYEFDYGVVPLTYDTCRLSCLNSPPKNEGEGAPRGIGPCLIFAAKPDYCLKYYQKEGNSYIPRIAEFTPTDNEGGVRLNDRACPAGLVSP
ncbi:unnamed protein product [Cercospora beticola]|nr:unnamed protein product [Cercospora beticola]